MKDQKSDNKSRQVSTHLSTNKFSRNNENSEDQDQYWYDKLDNVTKFTMWSFIFSFVIIVIVSIYFFSNTEFQQKVLNYFNTIDSSNINGLSWLTFIGILVIMTGFPLTIYELIVGFIMKDFWMALALVSVAKIIGFTICFLIARYLLKEKIQEMLYGNIYFEAIQKAATVQPMRICTVLKVMLIPTPIKTYGIGVLPVTFCEFFWPTVWTSPVLASVRVWMGTELNDIYEVTTSNQEYDSKEIKIELVLIALTIILFWYCMYLTKKVYDEIIAESEKMLREEEEQIRLLEEQDRLLQEEQDNQEQIQISDIPPDNYQNIENEDINQHPQNEKHIEPEKV